jgi:hypothetical protein
MSIELTDKQKIEFYKSLVTKSYTDAGIAIGLDKDYKTNDSLRSASHKLYKDLRPQELGISQDIIEMVQGAIEQRKLTSNRVITDNLASGELLDPEDTRGLVIGGRNKAAMLLHKKMDRISRSKKMLDALSLSQLATTFGIMFDKAQIVQGQATENIAVLSKIDPNMTAEMAIDALTKMREVTRSEKAEEAKK